MDGSPPIFPASNPKDGPKEPSELLAFKSSPNIESPKDDARRFIRLSNSALLDQPKPRLALRFPPFGAGTAAFDRDTSVEVKDSERVDVVGQQRERYRIDQARDKEIFAVPTGNKLL